jgi:DNA-binding PadR family transcriptional regulator
MTKGLQMFKSKLPDLTHVQILILNSIGTERVRGRELRQRLAKQGYPTKSHPVFYQLMGRLEDKGYVEGVYQQRAIPGQGLRERVYEVTGAGQRALAKALGFYNDQLRKKPVVWGGKPAHEV